MMKIKIVLSIPVPSILLTRDADEFADALHQLLTGGMYLTVEVFVQVVPE
jgi:hypothetical protein